jgi:peptidoglycan/xylan/chitin deacetylase (PgdA/CDA1 family)
MLLMSVVRLVGGAVALIAAIGSPAAASASVQNLIANPSVENAATEPSLPAGWHKGGWGDNTVSHRYRRGGAQDGRYSLLVTITRYKTGDAKWFFEPVSIEPNRPYVYSDYYRSNVSSELYLQFQDAAGITSHQYLGPAPKSKRWTEALFHFTTPATAVKVTVFHVITGVGQLQTDNFILELAQPLEIIDGVPNASLEQAHEGTDVPAGWQTGNWGKNSASFTYLKTGHTGRRSVKTQITAYTDGDAKWYFDPQPVTGGQHYRFTDWYRSNVGTQITAMIIRADGSTQYLGLPPAEASREWRRYSTKFLVPAGAVRASIFHVIGSVGYLIADDCSFVPSPTVGFDRPLVSLAFDDGWKSVRERALPILQRYGAPATNYILTGEIGVDPEYLNLADLRVLAEAGHQIASHSVNHLDLTKSRPRVVRHEVRDSKKFLKKNGFAPILDWASPYGTSSTSTTAEVKKVYRSQRSAQPGFNSKDDFDIYALKVQGVVLSTTAAEVQSWVDQAVREKTWLILLYHEVATNNHEYSTTPAQLESHLEILKKAGVLIVTVDQALREILPQM